MELFELPQLAEQTGIPVSLARYYRERFILFIPSVRIGRTVLHPPEAVEVMRRIHAEARSGASADAIAQILEVLSPIAITSSQPISDAGQLPGAAGVVQAISTAMDERGTRIELELTELRELVRATLAAVQESTATSEIRLLELPERVGASNEIERFKLELEDLRAQFGQLASREQLEWIGDVVSAAVVAPPSAVTDPKIEQQLGDLLHEIKRVQPSTEAAELRIAVERLTDYVHHRDAEMRKAFQTLVGALKTEVRGLRDAMDEVRAVAGTEPFPVSTSPIPFPTTHSSGLLLDMQAHADAVSESLESLKSRSPRRLGHPNKPADHVSDAETGGDASTTFAPT